MNIVRQIGEPGTGIANGFQHGCWLETSPMKGGIAMTAQSEALEAKLSVIQGIPKESIKSPSMPMDTYIQEAQYLYKW
jgi:hypothetical protein